MLGERGNPLLGKPCGGPFGDAPRDPGEWEEERRTFTPSHTLNIALHVYSHGVLVEVLVLVLVGVSADLLVVLLEGGDVLSGLAELAFLGYWLLMELLLPEPSSGSLAPRLQEQINSLISEQKYK